MRITGGKHKGRSLSTLKGLKIRPTSDNVREAIFNILGQDVKGFRVMDLFSGAGTLGIEALSRGALETLFVDKSSRALGILQKNLALCGFEKSGLTFRWDLARGIPSSRLFATGLFDLVFLDPPYGKGLLPKILEEISNGKILSPGAYVVAESYKNEKVSSPSGVLELEDERLYGDTKITFYRCEVSQI